MGCIALVVDESDPDRSKVLDLDLILAAHVHGLPNLLTEMLRAAGADASRVPDRIVREMRESDAGGRMPADPVAP